MCVMQHKCTRIWATRQPTDQLKPQSCKQFVQIGRDPIQAAEYLLARRQGPQPLGPLRLEHLLRLKAAASWTDDQLYTAVAHLLKHGVDVSEACKQTPSPKDPPNTSKQDEVAWLTQKVATRTLALLIKQRPACAVRLKSFETLRAGVLSNKEYTLLFLVARGADANPHLAPLTLEAIRHGASKALTWLYQWHDDVTADKLKEQLQAGLPDPTACNCLDTAATLEVLLAHGLSPNCTIQSTQQGSLAGPNETATSHTLLEWAVLHASAAAKARNAWPPALPKPPSPAPTPKGASTPKGPGPERAEHSSNGAQHSAPGTPLAVLPSRSSSSSGAASYGGPELLRVVIKAGANLNANKGAALLLAAQAHRGDLVAELVTGGADVTLPRLPNNTDLVKWAVDTKQCPTDSNVLQALLSASQKVEPIPATPVRLQDPLFTRTLSTRRVGSNTELKTPPPPPSLKVPASNGKENGSAAHPPLSPLPSLASRVSGLGASVSPMVTIGGNAAKQAAADKEKEKEAEGPGAETPQAANGTASKSQGGSRLPASLQTELQRDEAFLEAVVKNDLQIVKCMLEAGADVHYKQDKALLLAMGAIDPEQPDKWMPRPRDRAPVLSMSRPMVDLLITYGADVNARSGRALCQAARWRDDYSMKYILGLPGADRTWLDKDPTLASALAGSQRF